MGSGTRALWCELASCLPDRDFGIWPFDGAQGDLAERHHVVLAEIYPRVCYGLALATGLPASPLSIAKTDPAARAEFLDQFAEHSWLSEVHVGFDALGTARRHEDDFDALLSAVAILRCVESDAPMEGHETWDSSVEGSILGVHLIHRPRSLRL